jgi:hypothetical protein
MKGELPEEPPAGAEAHVIFSAFTARLKSRPDTKLLQWTSGMTFFRSL